MPGGVLIVQSSPALHSASLVHDAGKHWLNWSPQRQTFPAPQSASDWQP